MKAMLRRAAALLLCATLLLPTAALASDALGSKLYAYTLPICDNTTLTRQVMWSASRKDLRTENYVTYTPSNSVSPQVSYGSTVLSKQSVTSMAKSLERAGQRVLSGVNGDYYVMATGDPLGLMVTDGVLRSSASYHSAVGFRADGSAVVGKPALNLRADFKGYSLIVSDINKIRGSGNYYLFTDDFGTTTKNTKAGVDVILTPIAETEGQPATGADGVALTTSRQLKIGAMVPCRVEKVIEATGATTIPEGKFVLSIANTAGEWLRDTLRTLQPGDTLDLEIYSADTRWNDVESAVGGMYQLLSNGQVTSGLDNSTAAPRTAVGVKADGSVIFYTIDGRQSGYSVGATIQMVALRLKELGCTDALLLDGGGSTTLVSTYPDYDASSVVNKPSENSRAVSNAIFLVSNCQPTGQLGSLYVTPSSLMLLSGATTQCQAVGIDTGWYPLDSIPAEVVWSSPEGAVSGSGLFTAPAQTGVYTVTATAGEATGSTQIQVYDTPDSISVTNKATGKTVSQLSLTTGQQVDLNAAASYRTVGLTGGDTCFTWTADPDIGTIDKNGVFTAGKLSATGNIKVTAGNYAVTIAVTVSAPPEVTLLTDFEGDDTYFNKNSGTVPALDTTAASVAYGQQSLKLPYTLQNGTLTLTARQSQTLTNLHRYLALWVYGDNSGNTLSAVFTKDTGETVTQTLGTLSFTGWQRLTAAVPTGVTQWTGLALTGTKTTGTLWLDQLTLSNQKAADTEAPKVSLSVSGQAVTAKLSDNAVNSLAQTRLSLTLDGETRPFSFDAATGTLTATLPQSDGNLHRVTVTAADASGNLGRDSVTLSGSAASPFTDMTGHWAASYTTRLNQLGIITGTAQNRFSPDLAITRGDFALMAARWLGLTLSDYQTVTLPYTDKANIPAWDLEAIQALYALGIMVGSSASDGSVQIRATAPITRVEAMAILSRMQEKGYPAASLTAFSDAAAVPAWAKDSVGSLVGQKVVSGSDGKLRPTASITRAEVAKLLVTLW